MVGEIGESAGGGGGGQEDLTVTPLLVRFIPASLHFLFFPTFICGFLFCKILRESGCIFLVLNLETLFLPVHSIKTIKIMPALF